MSPATHLFISWVIAAKTTNPRDCRLVTLAGNLPDIDSLNGIVDLATRALGFWSLQIAEKSGYSFVGVFNSRLDKQFVGVLRKRDTAWKARRAVPK